MRIVKKNLVIIVAAFGCIFYSLNAAAQISNHELAKVYLEEYISGNIAGLEPYLSNDATFEDSADTFIGRDNIIIGLTRAFSVASINGYEEQDAYHSGAFYLTKGLVDFSVKAEVFGEIGEPYNFVINFAVSLKMSDGKVVSHRDYVDTKNFMEQLTKQQADRNKVE